MSEKDEVLRARGLMANYLNQGADADPFPFPLGPDHGGIPRSGAGGAGDAYLKFIREQNPWERDAKLRAERAQRILRRGASISARPIADYPWMWSVFLDDEQITEPMILDKARDAAADLECWRKAVWDAPAEGE